MTNVEWVRCFCLDTIYNILSENLNLWPHERGAITLPLCYSAVIVSNWEIPPANIETSLEKATTDDEALVRNLKSPTRRRQRREWTRAVREEERDRLREERKQGHQSNDQRKIACTRTSATHGSSDIPRLSPSGLGGVVRSASCRRVVMVAAIRRSQPASLAPIYLLTSNPTETTKSPSNSLTLSNDFYSQGIRISAIKQSPKLFLNEQIFLK